MIPTREECIGLLEKHQIKELKLVHTLLVEKVSLFLAKKLIEKGENIDLTILSRAALLHDIGKHVQRTEGTEHAKAGYDICSKDGVDEKICNLVGMHTLETILEGELTSLEEKILFYSDKIIKHEIIGIDERFRPWIERNPQAKEKLELAKDKLKKLEKEIFEKLDFNPEDLKEMIEKEE